jgi:hypothetical protein
MANSRDHHMTADHSDQARKNFRAVLRRMFRSTPRVVGPPVPILCRPSPLQLMTSKNKFSLVDVPAVLEKSFQKP